MIRVAPRSTVLAAVACNSMLLATGCTPHSPASKPIEVGERYTAPSANDYRCYAITWGGDLYTIDLKTGAATLAKSNTCTGANAMTTMPDGTLLIASTYNDQLIRFNPTSQLVESIQQMPESADIRGLAALPDGRVMGIQAPSGKPRQNTLVEIDPSSGEIAPLTPLNTETVQSLEADPTGMLYAYDNYKNGLMSIDPKTGIARKHQSFSPAGVFQSIAFAPDGGLIGYTHNQTNSVVRSNAIYSINTTHGACNFITHVRGKLDIRGIAIAPPVWQSYAPSSSNTDTHE